MEQVNASSPKRGRGEKRQDGERGGKEKGKMGKGRRIGK